MRRKLRAWFKVDGWEDLHVTLWVRPGETADGIARRALLLLTRTHGVFSRDAAPVVVRCIRTAAA